MDPRDYKIKVAACRARMRAGTAGNISRHASVTGPGGDLDPVSSSRSSGGRAVAGPPGRQR
jgi:hypothetical protein